MKYAGQLCWISGNPLNKLGLVMPYDDPTDSFVIACTNDTRLAGHLDLVFEPKMVGLPYAIAVLTHVSAWVATDRLTPSGGEVSPWSIAEIEGARAGLVPPTLAVGHRLGSPVLDPRWPLIEQNARQWLAVAR